MYIESEYEFLVYLEFAPMAASSRQMPGLLSWSGITSTIDIRVVPFGLLP